MGKVNVIVAARMTSSRLPGKILMELGGRPALVCLIERLKQSKYIHNIVIATTTNIQDDKVVATAVEQEVEYFREAKRMFCLERFRRRKQQIRTSSCRLLVIVL